MKRGLVLGLLALTVTGCTDWGDTTTIGTATGGVMGAGLGAMIGAQTGSTGAGIAIGSVAGAGTGALVGNALQERAEILQGQDEMVERREQEIAANRRALDELQRGRDTRGAFNPSVGSNVAASGLTVPSSGTLSERSIGGSLPSAIADQGAGTPASLTRQLDRVAEAQAAQHQPTVVNSARDISTRDIQPRSYSPPPAPMARQLPIEKPAVIPNTENDDAVSAGGTVVTLPAKAGGAVLSGTQGIKEANLMPDTTLNTAPGGTEKAVAAPPSAQFSDTTTTATLGSLSAEPAIGSAECVKARADMASAKNAGELADQLFFVRKALRLCPSDPAIHTGLADTYRTLNRLSDAEFEYREALKLDPNFEPAKSSLAALK